MSDGKEERGAAHFTPASQHSFTIKENSYGSKVVIQVAAETSIGGGPFSEKSTVLIGKITKNSISFRFIASIYRHFLP